MTFLIEKYFLDDFVYKNLISKDFNFIWNKLFDGYFCI